MKTRIWLVWMLGGLVSAQIELPDFMAPDMKDTDENVQVESPEEARHKREKEEEGVLASGQEELAPPALLDMMQQLQGRQVEVKLEGLEADGSEKALAKVETLLLGGPEEVVVRIQRTAGDVLQATVPNQTFMVKTAFGSLPVRLHEIQRLVPVRSGQIYHLDIVGGDALEGEIGDFHFWVEGLDGSQTLVPGAKILQLEVRPSAAAP